MRRTITVPGEPRGKGRPRFGNGRTYTDAKTRDYEMLVRGCWLRSTGRLDYAPYPGPVRVSIRAAYKIPQSASKAKRRDMLEGRIRPTKKPDADNIAKAILDGLNGVAWADDTQVVELSVVKLYSGEPCVVVEVESVEAGY